MKNILISGLISLIVCVAIVPAFAESATPAWSYYMGDDARSGDGIVRPYDQISIWSFTGSGTIFAAPTFTGLSGAGWTDYFLSDTEAFITGPDRDTPIWWTINFQNPSSDGAKFLYLLSDGDQALGRWEVTIRPSDSYFNAKLITDMDYWKANGGGERPVAPEPVGSALFLIGGGVLVARRIKNKKKT